MNTPRASPPAGRAVMSLMGIAAGWRRKVSSTRCSRLSAIKAHVAPGSAVTMSKTASTDST